MAFTIGECWAIPKNKNHASWLADEVSKQGMEVSVERGFITPVLFMKRM